MYGKGEGVPLDPDRSLRWCLTAARAGDIKAMYRMSYLYSAGQGVEQSPELALAWATLAAGRGNLDAVQTRASLMQGMSQNEVDSAMQLAAGLLERTPAQAPAQAG